MGKVNDTQELIAFLNGQDDAKPNRKRHRLPISSYTLSQRDFFFTICARHQGRPFADPVFAQAIIDSLLWRKVHHQWLLFCYCLMPDHLHFLARLLPREVEWLNAGARGIVPKGMLEQVGDFKKYTTTQIWYPRGGQGMLWQKSSYDRVNRHTDHLSAAIGYTLQNPVRKGLVTRWEDYPFCGIVDPRE